MAAGGGLSPQVVKRATRAAEFIAPCRRARLRCKGIEYKALLTEAGGIGGFKMQICTVQGAIDMGQAVIRVTDLEIAPQAVIRAVPQFDVELAKGSVDVSTIERYGCDSDTNGRDACAVSRRFDASRRAMQRGECRAGDGLCRRSPAD